MARYGALKGAIRERFFTLRLGLDSARLKERLSRAEYAHRHEGDLRGFFTLRLRLSSARLLERLSRAEYAHRHERDLRGKGSKGL